MRRDLDRDEDQPPQVPPRARETSEDAALEEQRTEAEHALRAATLATESIVEHTVDAAQRAGLDLVPPSDAPQAAEAAADVNGADDKDGGETAAETGGAETDAAAENTAAAEDNADAAADNTAAADNKEVCIGCCA